MELTWKEQHLHYFKNRFGDTRDKWTSMLDKIHDDRRLFCIRYDRVIEAISSLEDEPNLYVCVAMNERLHADAEMFKSIMQIFKGR